MAEQDNRRLGSESHGARLSVRTTSSTRSTKIRESVGRGTRSGSKGRNQSGEERAIPTRARKRTAEITVAPVEVAEDAVKKKRGKKEIPAPQASTSKEAAQGSSRSSKVEKPEARTTRSRTASAPAIPVASGTPKNRSQTKKKAEAEASVSTRSVRASTSLSSAATRASASTHIRPSRSSTATSSRAEHRPKSQEGKKSRAAKRSAVETGEEGTSVKARKSSSGSRRPKPSRASDPTPSTSSTSQAKQGEEKGRYPLRRQVRVDSTGLLIPLFPPSPVEIALAQGLKPAAPRRASVTWTLSSEERPENRSEESATGGAQLRVTLRRRTRANPNTGSCVSSRRSSRAGKVGSVGSWTMSAAGTGDTAGGSGTAAGTPAPAVAHAAVDGVAAPPSHAAAEASAAATPPRPPPAPGSSAAATMRELYELTSESEDNNDVGRLQALLESRGLPPHLFGALGPRMQHLLNRSITVSSTTKAQQLLAGLQASGDESAQLQAAMEMGQMLLMGNEDSLTGFPVKEVVPALITLLSMNHNFNMMDHACRALTYMMEALPRSCIVVVEAVPVFLAKLQEIQCMDVAEQSLTALETLSRRHSKSILQAHGVPACLKFLDFFSMAAQRSALSIVANCCQGIHHTDLPYVADSLSILASRLTRASDKKCVESICLSFCRLVDAFQNDPALLKEIASPELLNNVQQLLVESPPVISSSTFISVLRMLTIMCTVCPNLARDLLKQNMAETLCYLLTGTTHCAVQKEVELVPRSPQELYELTCLIGELMPRLPSDGIFSVNGLLERAGHIITPEVAQWQYQDEHGRWHSYPTCDSRLIEAASVNHEPEVTLSTRFNAATVNLNTMMQVCEDMGNSQPVRRRVHSSSGVMQPVTDAQNDENINGNAANESVKIDVDAQGSINEESELAAEFVRALFSTLYEVYSSSAGPAVRYRCLKALLRMVYYSSPDLLKEVLKKEMVASHIAGMLASHDLRIVVGAVQMANILMQKMPDVFGLRFMREGVTHELKQLSTTEPAPETPSTPAVTHNSSGSSVSLVANNGNLLPGPMSMPSLTPAPESYLKFSDVLSRKRKSKRSTATSSGGRSSKSKQEDPSVSVSDLLSGKSSSAGASSTSRTSGGGSTPRSRLAGASAKTTGFLASLNPARWGRSSAPPPLTERHFFKEATLSSSPSNSTLTACNKEKVRVWVRDTATKMMDSYFSRTVNTADVLSQLTGLIANMHSEDLQNGGLPALRELCDILKQSDISPFEVNHSGLVQALLQFLTDENNRDRRLRIFLHSFVNLPLDLTGAVSQVHTQCLALLVTKLNNCVSQLEQFPVKVHDLPAGARGGTSALKFFNTHQLKCNLQRHPDCTNLKQWKGGSVKIDPLALVQAIERYLVVRGYGRVRGHDSAESDDDNSEDDDIDDTLAAVVLSQGSSRHQLQFLIGDNVLPYNMTVYQAVRQFATPHADASETDTDSETPLGHSAIWVQTHTIMYRAAPPCITAPAAPTTRKHKGGQAKSHRKPDLLWTEGTVPTLQSPLSPFLTPKLPESVTISDPSLEVLALLRVLHAISRHWGSLYRVAQYERLLPCSSFISPKIAAKASRQLQDPLVIMTGNLPLWLQQIAIACPFLLPFETRQLLFYATSFDRDRALQRLLDTTPDLTSTDSSERVTPKLDRRKRTISRTDILKQAEIVIQDLGASRALLEVQYENEVGTGLGPTLEFYALVSKELQKSELMLWSGDTTQSDGIDYVFAAHGLYPSPLGHAGKLASTGKLAHAHLTKLKSKFRFLGKLMAKAVMDSRLLDISFSPVLYRWLLGQESSLSLPDLESVAPDVHKTLNRLLTRELSPEDSCLDFTLPGFADIELRKGGIDIPVTGENLDQYLQLVVHWRLVEGVSRQMEALKEGFEAVFPLQQLEIFYPEELDAVFCGHPIQSGWDIKTLSECFRPDHGYTADSRAIRFLLQVLSSYTAEEQRLFLQFVTGSPRLPVGGFKSLSPPLTIVRKDVEGDASVDSYLPSVMTCVNYLKLPDYTSVEVMRARLQVACCEGSHSFHLS